MKWEDVDLNECVKHIHKNNKDSYFVDSVKEILNLYANGCNISIKQKNMIKRYFIIEAMGVELFKDETIVHTTIEDARARQKKLLDNIDD